MSKNKYKQTSSLQKHKQQHSKESKHKDRSNLNKNSASTP